MVVDFSSFERGVKILESIGILVVQLQIIFRFVFLEIRILERWFSCAVVVLGLYCLVFEGFTCFGKKGLLWEDCFVYLFFLL